MPDTISGGVAGAYAIHLQECETGISRSWTIRTSWSDARDWYLKFTEMWPDSNAVVYDGLEPRIRYIRGKVIERGGDE